MAKIFITLCIRWLRTGIFFVLSLVTCCVVTICATLLIMSYDTLVLQRVEHFLCDRASNAFECDFNAHVERLDIFTGKIVLSDVVVLPTKGRAWLWTSDSITIQIDWVRFIFEKQINLSIRCGTMQIDTQVVDGKLALEEHIDALTREKVMPIPIVPEELFIHKAAVRVHIDPQTVIECTVAGAVALRGTRQSMGFTITHDTLCYHDEIIARDLNIFIKKTTDTITKKSDTKLHGTVRLRTGKNGSFTGATVRGTLNDQKRMISCTSHDDTGELILFQDTLDIHRYQLALTTAFGECTLTTHEPKKAELVVQRAGQDPIRFVLDYAYDSDGLQVTVYDDINQCLALEINKNLQCRVDTYTDFFYALVQKNLLPDQYRAYVLPYRDFLSYHAPVKILGVRTPDFWQLDVHCSGLQVRIPYTYNFLRSFKTQICYDQEKNYILVRDTHIQTDRGAVNSRMGTCILAGDTNALGTTIQSVHMPFCLHDFFVSRSKDFFAELSAGVCGAYQQHGRSTITGSCTLKKCHIRSNPFSGNLGDTIAGATLNPLQNYPLTAGTDLDLSVKSYEPIMIKTAFLQAQAHIALQIKGNLAQPEISGSIELIQGSLRFPYKPLEITSGKIFFVDNERDDPAIELAASAMIKNYLVTLYVDGTARHPLITFRSTPELEHEQIMGLLFGGSPDRAISLVMPLSSMAIVEKLIVGQLDESTTLASLKNIFSPLEHVKIVPRFSDQTARGGLKAALAIEVNDNLSALIQQNFSLSEDTLIEVAYSPTDELTLRGMRDERGDLGVELEARFTW